MIEVETVKLENGQEYIIFDRKNINGTVYVYMININNNSDLVIRKELDNMLVGLDDEEEFKNATKQILHNIGLVDK